jgi:hypothetical protein
MTIVLVCLLQGQSKEEYVERLKRESLAADESTVVQNMLQGLKFDHNFANNAGSFVRSGMEIFVMSEDYVEEAEQ